MPRTDICLYTDIWIDICLYVYICIYIQTNLNLVKIKNHEYKHFCNDFNKDIILLYINEVLLF